MAPTTRSGAPKSGARLGSPLKTPKEGGASKSGAASKKRKASSSPKSAAQAKKGPQKKRKTRKAAPKPNKGQGKSKGNDEEAQNAQSPTNEALSMKAAQDFLNSLNLPGDPFGPAPTRKGSKGKGKTKAPPVGLGIDFDGGPALHDEAEEWSTPAQDTEAELLTQTNEQFTAQRMPMPKSFSPIERGNVHREHRKGGPRASPTEGKGNKRKSNKGPAPVPPPAASPPPGWKDPRPMPVDYSPISYSPIPGAVKPKPLFPPPQLKPRGQGYIWDPFRPYGPTSPPLPQHHQPLYQPSTRTLTGLVPTGTPPRQTTEGGHVPGRPRPQRQRAVQNIPHPRPHAPPSPSAVRQGSATRSGAARNERQVRFSPTRSTSRESTSPITPRRFERELRRLQERLVTSPSEVTAIRRARALRRAERAGAAMEAARVRGASQEREAEGGSAERRRRRRRSE